jgi:hypothetical protein
VSGDLLQKDPENRLLARGPRFRLPAEMVRDQALAISGLLVEKVGGPSVKPYQPAGLWKELSGGEDYKQDKGEGLYRRSLYTWLRSTAPAPVMMTLNASRRDVCRVRRDVTDSPLQALVLLNGPGFLEASRVMGASLLKRYPDSPAGLISHAFRALTSRMPSEAEARVLRALYDEQIAHFEAHPDQAAALLKTGEAAPAMDLPDPQEAAAAILVNAIMNLDEALTKR